MHPVGNKPFPCAPRGLVALCALAVIFSFWPNPLHAQPATQGQVLSREGSVDFSRGQTNWSPAVVGQALIVQDRIRTLAQSRALLQLAELGRLRVNELTTLEVLPPRDTASKATVDLKSGAIYFFTRDKPREFQIQTPYALAASRGTEFSVNVDADGTSHYLIFDGQVGVTNDLGGVLLQRGDTGEARQGQAPVKTAVIQANNVVQWWLYYPGVIDTRDLPFTTAEQSGLAASLTAYQAGDLLGALAQYPTNRIAQSAAVQTYHAGLLLSVGQIDQALMELRPGNDQPAANALREVIAATSQHISTKFPAPTTASQWLAHSYTQQAHSDLAGALQSARKAAQLSPNFGFAWERVAELEFSFGHTPAAKDALTTALKCSPRNAQAWALSGFLNAAQQKYPAAREDFQKAIDLDGALGNAWLGRGLVRIHQGEREAGRADLQTAAALEPNRSVLRSYLGKAFDEVHDTANAERELLLAKQLDPADPTSWLYAALILREDLRFNEAVDDLEESTELNENRAVYRSQMLLDQDRAVRSASLATIYQDAGMEDVSVREAARAVDYDYANYSAHLFLSDSYNALRDPTDFNLRYDTPWLNELLLANLLAPPGAGTLSRSVTQHEYSKLFEGDRFGLSTDSEYNSDGQFKEIVSQFGSHGNTSYSLDLDYRHYDGVRVNNDLDRIEWFSQIKQQLTPKDSVMFFTEYRDYNSGDNFQYYNPTNARPNYRYTESQKPNVLVGFRHEWTPDIQTMLLGGWLQDDQSFSDKNASQLIISTNGAGAVTGGTPLPFDPTVMTHFEIWTLELNQIAQDDHQRLVAGGKFQSGYFHTMDTLTLSPSASFFQLFFNNPPATADDHNDFQRYSAYAYYTRTFFQDLSLTAGLSFEHMTYPTDFRSIPTYGSTTTREQLNPKGALVWSPSEAVTVRGIYARGMGGVAYDQTYRLEPTELAGFVQSFGSTIPESVVGAVSAPDCQVYGGAIDVKLSTRTYFGVQVQELTTTVDQQLGQFFLIAPPVTTGNTRETLGYREVSVAASLNQLVSDEWALGLSYRYTDSSLKTTVPFIATFAPAVDTSQSAALHQVSASILYNHPSGFFASFESDWYHQNDWGYSPALAATDFWQQNFTIGYRLKRQRGEISFAILNLGDQDYNLNPLTLYNELPRDRTYVGRIKFNF